MDICEECDRCHGSGILVCEKCRGEGKLRTEPPPVPVADDPDEYYKACDKCRGSGKLKCSTCKGTGLVTISTD